MDTVILLLRQILQMFLFAGMGFLLYRFGKITQEGSRTIGNILIYLSLPAVIINSFLMERTSERIAGIIISGGCAALLLLMSATVSHFVFRKDGIAAFAGAFSNPGFFGVPLIVTCIGKDAVFYVAFFIAFLNIGQWTYGVSALNGKPIRIGFSLQKILSAPFTIAILVGMILFLTQISLPEIISGCLSTVAGLNTPLAMFTVGIYLAQTDIHKMFVRKRLYMISAVRLLLIPIIAMLLLSLLPTSLYQMKMALLLAIACPVGTNVAVYAQLHNQDYSYAAETVVISTMLSVLTMPLILRVAEFLY